MRNKKNPLPTSPLAGGGVSIPSLDKGRVRVGLNLPKLRFPEFLGAGEWEVKKIGEVSKINPSSDSLPSEFIYIDLESVESGVLTQEKIISIDDAPSRAQRLLKEGDLIFQLVRPYQKNNLYFKKANKNYEYVASTGYAQIRTNQSSKYIFQYIHTDVFVSSVLEKCTGSSYPAINSNELAAITLPIPTLPEQQKIADCLSTLDDRIEAENQKLTQLKTHKKALMQQLFPAEGETVPRLRFSEFLGAGEWEVKNIGNVLTIGNGKDYKNLEKGDIPVYGTGGYMLSVNDYLYEGESVCIGRKGTIDKPVFLTGKFWTVDTLFYTHSFKECLPVFIYICFQQINWILYSEASGVPSLSKKTIEQIDINIPTLLEQQKISDCLSSLDELINLQTQKIATLKTHKKGMMQQLFPQNTNEGTV